MELFGRKHIVSIHKVFDQGNPKEHCLHIPSHMECKSFYEKDRRLLEKLEASKVEEF